MALAEQGLGVVLGQEVSQGIPLHLALSILGVPVAMAGLLLFRKGLRAEIEVEVSTNDMAGVGQREVHDLSASEGFEGESSGKPSDVGLGPPRLGGGVREIPTVSERGGPNSKRGIIVKAASTSIVCDSCGSSAPLNAKNCPKCNSAFDTSHDAAISCPVCGGSLKRLSRLSNDVFVCGLCFSELQLSPDLASYVQRINS